MLFSLILTLHLLEHSLIYIFKYNDRSKSFLHDNRQQFRNSTFPIVTLSVLGVKTGQTGKSTANI